MAATAEVNKLSELVCFRKAVAVIKAPDAGPPFLLGALVALPSKKRSVLGRLSVLLPKHKSPKRKRRKSTRYQSSSDSEDTSGSGSTCSDDDNLRTRHWSHKHAQEPLPVPMQNLGAGSAGFGAGHIGPGGGGGYCTPAIGPCYMCHDFGHIANRCPRLEGMTVETRAAAFAAAFATQAQGAPRITGG